MKEIRKKSNLPILILTAFSDEEYKIDAFTNLADGYIEKPFSLPVLKARIDSLIKKNYGHLEKFEYKDIYDFIKGKVQISVSIDGNRKTNDTNRISREAMYLPKAMPPMNATRKS